MPNISHPLPIGTTVLVRRDFAFVESIIVGYFYPSTDGGLELSQDPDHYNPGLKNPYWTVPMSNLSLTSEASLDQITGEL